jgi:hypothetical protein
MASVSADVALIQGLAATLGFECSYRNGNFVVAAKAGACLGLGGSGCVGAKVGKEQIAQFFMCIAHQLKQSDYKKIPQLMLEAHFYVFNKILYLSTIANQNLESFSNKQLREINDRYEQFQNTLTETGESFIKRMEQQLRSGWGWYSYMPPESRGAIIKNIVDAFNKSSNSNRFDLQKSASFVINELLSTTQSIRHLENTLSRVTVAMGQNTDRNQGIQLINSVIDGTIFENCVNGCEMRLANTNSLIGRPFLRNDEPDFRVAQFPLRHSAYIA